MTDKQPVLGREEIARIIDPGAYDRFADNGRPFSGYLKDEKRLFAALTKADDILNLLSQRRSEHGAFFIEERTAVAWAAASRAEAVRRMRTPPGWYGPDADTSERQPSPREAKND